MEPTNPDVLKDVANPELTTNLVAAFSKLRVTKAGCDNNCSDEMEAKADALLVDAKILMGTVSAIQMISRGSPVEAKDFPTARLRPFGITLAELPLAVQQAVSVLPSQVGAPSPAVGGSDAAASS